MQLTDQVLACSPSQRCNLKPQASWIFGALAQPGGDRCGLGSPAEHKRLTSATQSFYTQMGLISSAGGKIGENHWSFQCDTAGLRGQYFIYVASGLGRFAFSFKASLPGTLDSFLTKTDLKAKETDSDLRLSLILILILHSLTFPGSLDPS